MKRTVVQEFDVDLPSGETLRVCCGPAVAAIDEISGYRPVGSERFGVCHHTGAALRSELLRSHSEALDYAAVYETLGRPPRDTRPTKGDPCA